MKKGFALVMSLLLTLSPTVKNAEMNMTNANNSDELILNANYNKDKNYVELNWDVNDKSEPYTYQVRKRRYDSEEFQTVPSKETVEVLNVYPEVNSTIEYKTWDGTERIISKSAAAEMWMESPNEEHEKGYGMGLINVDPVSIDEFNENPASYLKDSHGDWRYDTIFFGAWDSNDWQDISDKSLEVVSAFIEEGRGVLLGHDTLDGQENKNFTFAELRSYANIELGGFEFSKEDVTQIGSEDVKVVKSGLLTTYPWEIKSELTIPTSHTGKQIAHGDIWMSFEDYESHENVAYRGPEMANPNTGKGTNNYYLTTWNNTAMIQTGHANGEATEDEQKTLANTLFYLAQITTDTNWKERSGVDTSAPQKVINYEVNEDLLEIEHVNDIGTEYVYQVVATGRDSNEVLYSNEAFVNVESGIDGYSYIIDNNPTTSPDGKINNHGEPVKLSNDTYRNHYLHIQSIDRAGNKSETSHIKLDKVADRNPPSLHLTQSPKGWTNDKVTVNVDSKDDESGLKNILIQGEDKIKNGDFSKVDEDWLGVTVSSGERHFEKGMVTLKDTAVGDKNKTKFAQVDVLSDGLRDNFLVKIEARGKGKLNARFGVGSTGLSQVNRPQEVSENKKVYDFFVPYDKDYLDQFIIELMGAGEIEITNVELIETKELVGNTLDIHQNGTYNIIATDNSENMSKETIKVENIDKEPPTATVTQSTDKETRENVVLTVNAKDNLSGIRSVTYIGDNMIRDGSFQEGGKHWKAGGAGGEIRLEKGSVFLDDNTVIQNKLNQANAFVGSEVGAQYFAKIGARGEGVLNARYSFSGSGVADTKYKQDLMDSEDYQTYTFPIIRKEDSNDGFHIERIGFDGWIQINHVELYAQKELHDGKLEVTRNGVYTFIIEDNAGNVTIKTHHVTNINKYTKLHRPTISPFPDTSISDENQSVYANIKVKVEDWRDSPGWKLSAKSTELTNGIDVLPMKLNGRDLINSIEVVGNTEDRGVYEDNVGNLEISIPSTVKAGKYEAKITWELTMAP